MNCVECEETITNPVCSACLSKGVKQWLQDEKHELLLRDVASVTNRSLSGETICIKCGEQMDLCTYCYTKDVFDVVKKYPSMLSAYVTYFNFDLEHLGWEREARFLLED